MLIKLFRTFFVLGLLVAQGCAPKTEFVSQQAVEEKVSRITLGQTTMPEVEAIFGVAQLKDARFWAYNMADTTMDFTEVKTRIMPGMIPPMPTNVPTNTRALVTVRFDEPGTVKGLEISRYFSAPYIHDYWYLVRPGPENPLESAARLGEANGFKVSGLEKSARSIALESTGSKARINVSFENQILHITSTNPYDRLSAEYRVFVKRESAFIASLLELEALE